MGGGGPVRLRVEFNADWKVERIQLLAPKNVAELLDAQLMLDGWVSEGCDRPGLVEVLAALTVNVEQLLGFHAEKFEGVRAKWRNRRDAVRVAELTEIRLAQAEQTGTANLRVTAD